LNEVAVIIIQLEIRGDYDNSKTIEIYRKNPVMHMYKAVKANAVYICSLEERHFF